jgi:hypothetical protein
MVFVIDVNQEEGRFHWHYEVHGLSIYEQAVFWAPWEIQLAL